MVRPGSLVHRVAWAATFSASTAALIASVSASALVAFLLLRAEDRRLRDAAGVLAFELAEVRGAQAVRDVVRDELRETSQAGILFAVASPSGQHLAGDRRVGLPSSETCDFTGAIPLRRCRVAAVGGLAVVTASPYDQPAHLFALAALQAVLIAGAVAWLASRPTARRTVAPLSRLRAQLDEVDAETQEGPDLGPIERVFEVDQLRSTIDKLLRRVASAREQTERFTANAAHELRTPLTTVRAELELMLEDASVDGRTRSRLSHVHTRVSELGVIVERLLVLAMPAMATGTRELVSLRDLAEDVVVALGPRERVELPDTDALVCGDSVLLHMMLANAISNALKFGTRVGIRIEVRGPEAVIAIDDDGPGVPAPDRSRVFEPFVRGNKGRNLPGTGLGLALIAHVAGVHRGRAAFVDKAGPGARLEVVLPATPSQNGALQDRVDGRKSGEDASVGVGPSVAGT